MSDYKEYIGQYKLPLRELLAVIWRFVKPYRTRFFLSSFVRFIAELAFTFTPFAFARYLTLLSQGAPHDQVYWFIGLWGISYFVRAWGQRLGRWLGNRVREDATIDMEETGAETLTHWSLVRHELENTGNKVKRIHRGAEGLNKLLSLWQDQWIAIFTHMVVMLLVISVINIYIGFALVVFLIVYWSISRPLLRRAATFAHGVNAQDEEVAGFIFEINANIRTVKVMNLFPWLKSNLLKLTTELRRRIYKRVAAYQQMGTITNTFAQTARVAFVIFIVMGIFNGQYDVGFLLLFNMYFTNLRDSSEALSDSAEEFAIARFRIARYINAEAVAKENPEAGKTPFPTNWQTLTIKNLSFAYGDNDVFSNINLTIRRGERVGIMGLSGAGKSTLFKLLLKEHQNFGGDILFDNVSIRDIDPVSFAAHTAVVLQDTEVFNLSLKDNIVLGVDEKQHTAERIQKAISVSHVQDFLNKLPAGLGTIIGERGVRLSGGERQRVGIARAVFKEPQILFLDEATSHLDVESEDKIQDSLHRFFGEVTAVVIAHRLTTIKEMDRIIVMENGTILSDGPFEKLYAEKGRFYDLWEKQKL